MFHNFYHDFLKMQEILYLFIFQKQQYHIPLLYQTIFSFLLQVKPFHPDSFMILPPRINMFLQSKFLLFISRLFYLYCLSHISYFKLLFNSFILESLFNLLLLLYIHILIILLYIYELLFLGILYALNQNIINYIFLPIQFKSKYLFPMYASS